MDSFLHYFWSSECLCFSFLLLLFVLSAVEVFREGNKNWSPTPVIEIRWTYNTTAWMGNELEMIFAVVSVSYRLNIWRWLLHSMTISRRQLPEVLRKLPEFGFHWRKPTFSLSDRISWDEMAGNNLIYLRTGFEESNMLNVVKNRVSNYTFQRGRRRSSWMIGIAFFILTGALTSVLVYYFSTPLKCYHCSWAADTLKPTPNSSCHLNQHEVRPNHQSNW